LAGNSKISPPKKIQARYPKHYWGVRRMYANVEDDNVAEDDVEDDDGGDDEVQDDAVEDAEVEDGDVEEEDVEDDDVEDDDRRMVVLRRTRKNSFWLAISGN
jgi:hypothetical protein